ncbi:MAG: DNA-directed RNA polymerase subunit omega [Christensenellaceae bacterium]|jgi:DNA-directed RNA polymerase subunit K/omega|nr:DNA-directed RNA polymerase subunit omega [Christensenellaceae bacterium]
MAMIYPNIEICINNAGGCKFILIPEVIKRARDLKIKNPQYFKDSNQKEISCALKEIFEGEIRPTFDTIVQGGQS